jgi:hypothetical protein
MMTALITFLGGATARLILGHVFDFLTKWQDSRNELARLQLQGQLDAAQFERSQAAIKLQADLGIKVIEAQTEAHVTDAEADAFVEAVKATGQKTGVVWVDVWNGIIRPFLATMCIALWIASLWVRNGVLDDWDRALMSLALGIFVGGRIHATGR